MSLPKPDVEASSPQPEFLEGYKDFSEFIGSDSQFSIYRQFSSLGARNLLYLEAEIQLIEFQLKALDDANIQVLKQTENNDEKNHVEDAARAWELFQKQAKEGDERTTAKLALVYKLRKLMKDYEKALLRRKQILALEKPDKGSFKAFKNWFRSKKPLRGSGWHLLDNESDMISLYSEADVDRLTTFIQRHFGYYLRQERDTPLSWGQNHLYYYPMERIGWISVIVSILMSALLLIGPMVTCYYVKPMSPRLGIVGAFTTAFAASIGILTNARRPEVFGSTAAYSAVLVVFVSVNA